MNVYLLELHGTIIYFGAIILTVLMLRSMELNNTVSTMDHGYYNICKLFVKPKNYTYYWGLFF